MSQPANTTDTLPFFYRFYFLWSDPAICLWGAYMDFFTPSFVINAFIPLTLAPWNDQHIFVLQQLGGALLMLCFLDLFLLRYSKDIVVWKILQAATMIYDMVLLWSVYGALRMQGRLNLQEIRWEDWGGIAITGLAVLVRGAFLLDVGLSKHGKSGKEPNEKDRLS